MSQEVWFRANDDRREICCDVGSAVERLVSSDPSFTRIDGPQGVELAPGPEPIIVDLSWMSEFERIELAKTILGG